MVTGYNGLDTPVRQTDGRDDWLHHSRTQCHFSFLVHFDESVPVSICGNRGSLLEECECGVEIIARDAAA